MKRVMVVGQPGAGKSTLARRLGDLTGLPVVHVDRIHWKEGWQERPLIDKITRANAEEAEACWVFEGGLSATWDNRLDRADTLIVLDMPLPLRLWRVLKRWVIYRGKTRPDLPSGCPERLDPEFLGYIWKTRRTGRAKMLALIPKAAGKRVHHLRSPAEIRHFLDNAAT